MEFPRTFRIAEIREESPKVKSFFFEFKSKQKPGQFLMVWVPGAEEVPMSVSYSKGNRIGMSVFNVGKTTARMQRLRVGDYLGLRGPYGNEFKLKGKNIALIGGGCGSSPLIYLAEQAAKKGIAVTSFVGAKNKNELLFLPRFRKVSKVFTATDDGSSGYKGFVTDLFREKMENFDCVYTCGPELMMKNVLDICLENGLDMQASLERYMKCGVGVCGACMIDGYRVCKDGPVFDIETLENMKDFGKTKRNSSGTKIGLEEKC